MANDFYRVAICVITYKSCRQWFTFELAKKCYDENVA